MSKQIINFTIIGFTIITLLIISGISLSFLDLSHNTTNIEASVSFTPPIEPVRNRIEINIPSRKLFLIHGDLIIKEYEVGVGKSKEFMTPLGEFKVQVKDSKPGWESPSGNKKIAPGAANPLGTRWIGFYKSKNNLVYGVHGTNEPNSVGKFVSHGCIRMKIADAEELFDQVEIGTPIKIRYDRIEVKRKHNNLALTIYPDPYGLKALDPVSVYKQIRAEYPTATIYKAKIQEVLNKKAISNLTLNTGFFES